MKKLNYGMFRQLAQDGTGISPSLFKSSLQAKKIGPVRWNRGSILDQFRSLFSYLNSNMQTTW